MKVSLQFLTDLYSGFLGPYYEKDEDGNVTLCDDYYNIVDKNPILSFSAGFLTRLYEFFDNEFSIVLLGVTKNEAFFEGYYFANKCVCKLFVVNFFDLKIIRKIKLFDGFSFRFFSDEAKKFNRRKNEAKKFKRRMKRYGFIS